MHGAEFYANKKHKGINNGSDNGSEGGTTPRGAENSPRNDDAMSGKAPSLSSPSIKSESDANSPGQQQVNSPMSVSQLAVNGGGGGFGGGVNEDYDNLMSNGGNNVGVPAIDDPEWPFEDEDVDVSIFLILPQLEFGIY